MQSIVLWQHSYDITLLMSFAKYVEVTCESFSSVAATVAVMCILVTKASREDPEGDVAKDCRRV